MNYCLGQRTTRLASRAAARSVRGAVFADDFLPTYDTSDGVGVVVGTGQQGAWDALMEVVYEERAHQALEPVS